MVNRLTPFERHQLDQEAFRDLPKTQGFMPDWLIIEYAKAGMIEPFATELINRSEFEEKIVSFGPSSFGYDLRLSDEFKICTDTEASGAILDPLKDNSQYFHEVRTKEIVIPPHGFVLGRAMERLNMPRDVLGFVIGKSTLSRLGLVSNITPGEPGWDGKLTLELSNTAPMPIRLYAGMGICQITFAQNASHKPHIPYDIRDGKYQYNEVITLAKV